MFCLKCTDRCEFVVKFLISLLSTTWFSSFRLIVWGNYPERKKQLSGSGRAHWDRNHRAKDMPPRDSAYRETRMHGKSAERHTARAQARWGAGDCALKGAGDNAARGPGARLVRAGASALCMAPSTSQWKLRTAHVSSLLEVTCPRHAVSPRHRQPPRHSRERNDRARAEFRRKALQWQRRGEGGEGGDAPR